MDISALACHGPVDLPSLGADFACLSFYKMFGYPTGLGALFIRNGTADMLQLSCVLVSEIVENSCIGVVGVSIDVAHLLTESKLYFGGGTVGAISSTQPFNAFREQPNERLEDGTVSFLGIATLAPGFSVLQQLGMHNIQRYGTLCRDGSRSWLTLASM